MRGSLTRFPGPTCSTQGTASILVDDQDGFTWERRTGKTIYISTRSEDATARFLAVTLPRKWPGAGSMVPGRPGTSSEVRNSLDP